MGLRREDPTTTAATYRTSRVPYLAQQQEQAVEVAAVVVRTSTPTPDLGQLRRLPRQVVPRTGACPRTIRNTLLWSDGWMLFLQFAPFCVSFSEQFHNRVHFLLTRTSMPRQFYILYALLATSQCCDQAASDGRRGHIYRLRDSSLLQSVLCGVHAALCWSLCALLVLFVVPLLS